MIDSDRRYFQIAEIPAAGGQIGVARDVTDLETAKDDLERHVGAYTDVLEKLNTGVAIWGPDRRLKFFNRAYAKLFRLDENWLATEPDHEELIELLRQNRSIPEHADFQAYKKRFMDMYTTLVDPIEELDYLPNGTTLRVGSSPHPLGGLLFFYEDMSDQLELERARNTLIAVQRTILDNLSQGVEVYGGDGRLKLFNRAYSDPWGFDEDFLASEPHISELIDHTRPQIIGASTEPESVESVVNRTLDRVGHRQRIERTDELVLDRTTVPLPDGATLVTHLDVTDTMRIERALRERTEALEEADRLKSQFIANVSYELRTPLNTIGGFSEILIDQFFGELNPRQLEYIEGIFESSGHLLAPIDDILDLANIEAGRMRPETETFDISEMIASVVHLVEERIFERKLQLHIEVPPDIGTFHADERRVPQVIYNLIGNALRFTESGGVIRVGATRGDDEVSIWVADNGRGLGWAEQMQIFERFNRSGSSSTVPGTGLGLALVKSFVDLHGGRVELEPSTGKGTRVTCIFPLNPSGALSAP